MGKKVKEYKAGHFIFAKVKGYPAWPARVQKLNGKKYFVYFYGTGETANLPPNMIFDYAENKDKFLSKAVKRRDFNDGVKQIEFDFANNVPIEQVIGADPEAPADESINDSAINDTVDESAMDTTTADHTGADTTTAGADSAPEPAVEDSDEAGTLVIDEGKQQKAAKKSKVETPKPEAAKTPKTSRGKSKTKEDQGSKDEEAREGEKKDDELVSRSGRKIRPKRYIDEHTEENTALPSPAIKRRRGASPALDKEKEKEKEKPKEKEKEKEKDKSEPKEKDKDKNIKHFNTVPQSELEGLKQPFKPADPDKENILMAYLPTGQYIGIKLFQNRPSCFRSDSSKLNWEKQAATNAITLKTQLEKGYISPQSVLMQLVMDLSLSDEEKATLEKERETEDKKARVQFLKTELKLMELDAKIKTCLCLEKADTDLCLKLLDQLMQLDVKPLMLLKHPSCLETVKRMRAYVGNTPAWDLSEDAALTFSKQAHRIRKQADVAYRTMKELFSKPDGLSFWEYFSERVVHLKKVTSNLSADEMLEIVEEPLELSTPSSHSLSIAVEYANEEPWPKGKATPGKSKKQAGISSRPSLQRKSSKEDKSKGKDDNPKENQEDKSKDKEDKSKDKEDKSKDKEDKTKDKADKSKDKSIEEDKSKDKADKSKADTNIDKEDKSKDKESKSKDKADINKEKQEKSKYKEEENKDKEEKSKEKEEKRKDKEEKRKDKEEKIKEKEEKIKEKESKSKDKEEKSKDKADKNKYKADKNKEQSEEAVPEVMKAINDKGDEAMQTSEEEENGDGGTKDEDADNNMEVTVLSNRPDVVSDIPAEAEKDKISERSTEESDKSSHEGDSEGKEKEDKKKEKDEPRAKRSRGEHKKTEAPPLRSPTKRKAKV